MKEKKEKPQTTYYLNSYIFKKISRVTPAETSYPP